jgi:hypothetical protein
VLSTIADSHTTSQLAHGASNLGALTSGYQLALGIGALISLLGAFLTVLLLRPRASEAGLSVSAAALSASEAAPPASEAAPPASEVALLASEAALLASEAAPEVTAAPEQVASIPARRPEEARAA